MPTYLPVGGYEAELPAVYLDGFIEETFAGLFVGNRIPSPAETNVPLSSSIQLDLLSTDAAAVPTTSTLTVYVGDAAAVLNGVAQAGFALTTSVINALTLRIVITPSVALPSDAGIAVRVAATAGTYSVDEPYAFTTVDLTAPEVVSAAATAARTVRVVFSEPMRHDSVVNPVSTLRPGNYTLTRTSTPAVSAVVTAVTYVDDSVFDLTTDIELSHGATYTLTVTSVTDEHGNTVAPGSNVAAFTAWRLPAPAGRDFDLYQMLPVINRQEDITLDLFKFISCLQEVTDLLLYESDRFYDVLDPDTAPEYVLDLMLQDLGNPFQFELSALDKRRLLSVLVAMYSLKGTARGIRSVIQFFLGVSVTVTQFNTESGTLVLGESELGDPTLGGGDWQLGSGTSYGLYAFEVSVPQVLTQAQRAQMRQIIDYMKPAHTHLVRINEPTLPPSYDHLELGVSELGVTWDLH